MTPENGKTEGAQKAPRHRSPNYPGISLSTAVEKITSWYKADGIVASSKEAAMKHMGGDAGRVVSALKSFGLISEADGRIKLTQRGIDIVARGVDDLKRKQAIKEAGLSPAVYAELVTEYSSGLPSDTTLQSELIAGRKFNPKAVSSFIEDFRATLEFAGITKSSVVDSKAGKEEKAAIQVGDFVQWESGGVLQFIEAKRIREISDDGAWAFVDGSNTGLPIMELTVMAEPPIKDVTPPQASLDQHPRPRTIVEAQQMVGLSLPPKSGTRQDVFSLTEGTVTIQWPADLSNESFEDLSAWIDILKRKIGRSVKVQH
jgi:hypothetical protein